MSILRYLHANIVGAIQELPALTILAVITENPRVAQLPYGL